MKTAVINFKTDPSVKKEAQMTAKELGLNLSVVLDQLLRRFVREKELHVALEPTPFLEKQLKQSKKDIAAGYVSPAFDNVEDSIAWLDDPDARYANGRKVR